MMWPASWRRIRTPGAISRHARYGAPTTERPTRSASPREYSTGGSSKRSAAAAMAGSGAGSSTTASGPVPLRNSSMRTFWRFAELRSTIGSRVAVGSVQCTSPS